MRHTFLFEEGRWEAEGELVDAAGGVHAVTGHAEIEHAPGVWRNRSTMTLPGEAGAIEIRNDYEIRPFEEGEVATPWTSTNPALGRLTGHFVRIADTILSSYRSADGRFRGTECLRRLDDDHYEGRGALLGEDGVISSWAVRLVRSVDAGADSSPDAR